MYRVIAASEQPAFRLTQRVSLSNFAHHSSFGFLSVSVQQRRVDGDRPLEEKGRETATEGDDASVKMQRSIRRDGVVPGRGCGSGGRWSDGGQMVE